MSASFHGGPADGFEFDLERAPFYVRVVVTTDLAVPIPLEGPDVPEPDEEISVYVRPGEVLRGCVIEDGVKTYPIEAASYVWLPEVDGESVRHRDDWAAWARAQPRGGLGRVGETSWPLAEAVAS